MIGRVALGVLSLSLAGCADDEASRCYAAGEYAYAGRVRAIGALGDRPVAGIALPDGRALALTLDADLHAVAWTIDPASGAVVQVAGWGGRGGPMAVLEDGRVFVVDEFSCQFVVIDPSAPGSPEVKDCGEPNFDAKVVWPVGGGQVWLFGDYYGEDGNGYEGAVFELGLADGGLRKVWTRTTDGFGERVSRPLQLCDGRLLFAGTLLDGGDFKAPDAFMHYYDPAARVLTSVESRYSGWDAVQLDAETALVLGVDDAAPGLSLVAYELDVVTGAAQVIAAPPWPWDAWARSLVDLAGGSALLVDVDLGIHRYDPAARAFVAQGVAFAATPWVLLRLSTGPVLAIDKDGAIALFE